MENDLTTNDVVVLPHQIDFIMSEHRHTGLVAGFGSGKSRAATLKTIEMKKRYPGVNVAYYLPTYKLIEDVAHPNFEQALTAAGIPYVLNKGSNKIQTTLGEIIFRSMDSPGYIVGYEVGYSIIDEADILGLKKMNEAVKNIVARNRAVLSNGDRNHLDFVSTPEGFQFMYKFFVKNKSTHRRLIRARTKDNPYLPDDYIETLSDIYTPEQLQAYLDGEFVNLTSGTVYYKFDRKLNHNDATIEEHEVLHIGMDFNVTNMNAVVNVVRAGKPIAVEEIVNVWDTPEMIEHIKRRYKDKGHQIVVYPDASGDARNTTTFETDIGLLKKARFKVIAPTKNPLVKTRVTNMNIELCGRDEERHYTINTNNCPTFTEALEQQAYRNDVPDKKSGHDHINEAGGYFIMGYKTRKRRRMTAT